MGRGKGRCWSAPHDIPVVGFYLEKGLRKGGCLVVMYGTRASPSVRLSLHPGVAPPCRPGCRWQERKREGKTELSPGETAQRCDTAHQFRRGVPHKPLPL